MSAPKWAVGMQRLMPGVYVKGTELHFDLEELCAANGYVPTPENCRKVQTAAEEVLRQTFGDVPVTDVIEKR